MDLIVSNKKEKTVIFLFFLVLTLLWVFPVYSAIRNSLRVNGIDNYIYVLTHKIADIPIYLTFFNSLFIALANATLILFIGSVAAYAFSKISFKGKEGIYIVVLMCLSIPAAVTLVPFFFILKNIGMYNSLWGVVLAQVAMNLPFVILVCRNYFDGLPNDLLESARIDGANIFQIFSRIYLPMAKPILANMGILSIMWSFQDFLFPLMYLTDKDLTTATMAISSFKGVFGMNPADAGRYNAALVILGIPAILVFIFAQRFIAQGITAGAVKE
ncbi:carbohydrate ABC transporter permease [Marinicrinis lubricantis]|uniref:Carbohydrate ABC transporter permease n=1 Tax=Marinicrinis lubricantis TaxID=2086470 RepID=A0ABW1IPE5_9BACL